MIQRWTEGVRREVLPNGLTLLVQRFETPAVAVVSFVRTGFFDEPDPLVGVSHVLEHMLFKGTPTRGVGVVARETRAAGGSLNAGTGYDHTVYTTILPPAAFRIGVEVQSDAVQRSTLEPEELGRELIVIIEEAKRKLDSPASVAAETLHALLFDRHRMRRWRIGTEAQLARLERDAVLGFYRSRYVPENTVIVVTGGVDPDEASDAIREFYGAWPSVPPVRDPSPSEPAWREVRARTLRGDVRGAELALGWRTVEALHPDAIPLDLAGLILSAGRAGWLYQRLRVPGIMTSVGASNFTPTEVGVFSASGELDPSRLPDALSGIAECLTRLRIAGPGEGDLARVRTMLQARWARRLETVEGRAHAIASAEALRDYRLLDEEYERLLTVSAGQIRRAADKWLRPDAVCGVAYLPAGAAETLEPDRLREAFARAESRLTRLEPSRRAPIAELRVPSAEPPVPSVELRVPNCRAPSAERRAAGAVLHVELPGADLLLQRKPGVPLVSISVYQRRSDTETLATAGLGALTVRSAIRGAGEYDAMQLALAFEGLGGSVAPIVGSDVFGFGTSVLAEHAAEAGRLLDLVLRVPRFAEEEVARERQTILDRVVQDTDDMMAYPIQLAFRARFGPAGYGLPVLGLPESVPGLRVSQVRGWHRRTLAGAATRPAVIAVGEIDPERLADHLALVFTDYPGKSPSAEPPSRRAAEPSPLSRQVGEGREKRQTGIALLFPGPSRLDPERHAADVWSAIAGGLGGRLFTALRDQRSLAYVVRASVWQRIGAGGLLVYLGTSPEREAEARVAILEAVAAFAEREPEPQELEGAVRYLAGQLSISRQKGGSIAAEIADAWLTEGEAGLLELLDPAAGIRAVSPRAVQDLSRRCFAPGLGVEGLVRGAAMFPAHG
ncbi:MAG: M16 family metallopeptidase [Gemmatimonadales bacterium]